ncbi:unnamed protein product [Polarella glacialis]|uniref:Uncharacterized protein n=1 Tax=Polarella glacialis TaxID=89957 RepID=A0A813G8L8_POLGL|nr:unnamed protein product [Polarella glacialis]
MSANSKAGRRGALVAAGAGAYALAGTAYVSPQLPAAGSLAATRTSAATQMSGPAASNSATGQGPSDELGLNLTAHQLNNSSWRSK